MQVQLILTQEEYDALQPNKLSLRFVEAVRTILGERHGDSEGAINDIFNELKHYDAEAGKANDGQAKGTQQ